MDIPNTSDIQGMNMLLPISTGYKRVNILLLPCQHICVIENMAGCSKLLLINIDFIYLLSYVYNFNFYKIA